MLVVRHTLPVRNGGSVLIYHRERMNELALAFGARTELLGPLNFLLRNRNCRGGQRGLPKLVKVRHSHSPMCHRTTRVQACYLLKCVFCRDVSKGVKESHSFIELLLSCWRARNRKRYLPQLLRRGMAVCLLCRREGNDEWESQQYSPSVEHPLSPSERGAPATSGFYGKRTTVRGT